MSTALQKEKVAHIELPADSELPEGWILASLPDVCDINPPKPPVDALPVDSPVTFVPMPAVDADAGAITKPEFRPFAKARNGFTAFREGDVILAKITPCMENGKAAIARNLRNGLGFGSTEFHVLRSKGAALPEYIYRFIRQESFRRAAEAEMTGSVGQRRVPADFLRQVELPIAPLAEQTRIVAKIEELLAQVNAARARLAKVAQILKRFRQSVLAAACSGGLTEGWRDKKDVGLEDWKGAVLADVADMRLGKMLDNAKNVGTSTPYLRNVNVRWFAFDLDHVFSMRATNEDKKELDVRNGDLFVCEGGEPGRCAVWNLGPKNVIFQKAIHRIRLRDDISPDWLAFNIKHNADAGVLEELFTGSGIKHLTGRSLATYTFQVPTLKEQHEIVRRVEALFKLADETEKRVSMATKRADKLTQAILAKAFRGEIVPTEAELARREGREYEHGSVLLNRIWNERGSSAGAETTNDGSRLKKRLRSKEPSSTRPNGIKSRSFKL